MVKLIFVRPFIFFLCFLLAYTPLAAATDIKINAEVENRVASENLPINAWIIISHPKDKKIEIDSFKIKNTPLKVEAVSEQKMTPSDGLVVSIFRFQLASQSKGLYVLPEISVMIAGKKHRSVSTTYEVQSSSGAETPETSAGGKFFLKLENVVEGPLTLYPGQKTILGYRYVYNTNIDTTVEELPLLEAEGLTKIGDKIAEEDEQQGVSSLHVYQIVKADKLGSYTFGPSTVEGYPYQVNALGQHIYAKQKLSSVAVPVTITVVPFPSANKPLSFNGALGDFVWQVKLLSKATVSVGDELELQIEVSGQGDLDSVNLPELCCEPGMSGSFRLADLPPVGHVEKNVKRFTVKMRPLSAAIKEIPSLEFSSFDPDAREYKVSHSEPIALNVLPEKVSSPTIQEADSEKQPSIVEEPWRQSLNETAPIEIKGYYPLSRSDLYHLPFGTWWWLLSIPVAIGALLFQMNLIKVFNKEKEEPEIQRSEELFSEAMKADLGSPEQYALLNNALSLKLVELGLLDSVLIPPEKFPKEGLAGEVRTFLCGIEKERFTGLTGHQDEEIKKRAEELFDKLKLSKPE